MKAKIPTAIALVLWFLYVVSNAFAVHKSPYPQKAVPSNHIIVISDGSADHIIGTTGKPK